MEKSRRVQRVEKELKQVIGQFITHKFMGLTKNIVTVSQIFVSKDLRSAKVFLSFLGGHDIAEDLELFQQRSHEIQSEVGRQIPMKYCPKLQFLEDKSLDHVMKIDRLLHEIKS